LSVAINESSIGLIGGKTPTNGAYAAFVFPDSTFQAVSGLPPDGSINSVAINELRAGIIGGVNGHNAYAALVFPGASPQPLIGLPEGTINSVAINQFNQGLIGGIIMPSRIPYAAVISSSGQVIPLTLSIPKGNIISVAINSFFLSELPTQGLKGNNLIFANYINANAPQDVFYFIPALVAGSYAQALESAAPTRNAISFNTVMQNTFYLTTALSTHLRTEHFFPMRAPDRSSKKSTAALELEEDKGELLAGRCFPESGQSKKKCLENGKENMSCTLNPITIWFDAIGALAYQDAQHETPSFTPSTGGGSLAFDARLMKELIVGGGSAYLYTHVHEKHGAGNCHINQEDLFIYASWAPSHFYLDLALWGGMFQTHQTREIHMTGFAFTAHSKPHGWQLIPHLELGWLGKAYSSQKCEITWNLLGMADWANAWQKKYSEKGAGPFNIQQNSHHGSLLRTEAGLRFTETLFFKCWNLIFQEKGSYVNIQSFNAGKVHAFLLGSPGSFTVETLTNSQNLGAVLLAVTGSPYKSSFPATTLFYQGEFGSKYQSNQLTIELAWNF
jgi:hypothetical protein